MVSHYRQLGYENRQLKKEDFRNDAVDAGEVGSGQAVTVRVRYRRTDNNRVEEIAQSLTAAEIAGDFNRTDARFQLAACVAEFAEILRGSPFAQGSEFNDIAQVLRPVALELSLDARVAELSRMVEAAPGMSRGE